LFDYGGTLVEEVGYDARAGHQAVLARVGGQGVVDLEELVRRAERISRELGALRVLAQVETPWTAQARLLHDSLGIRVDEPLSALERVFWRACAETLPMRGAAAALEAFAQRGLPMGVVSNSSFGGEVLRDELSRHGLDRHLAFVMASADYALRKPRPLLFEVAAAKLGLAAEDVWFVGDRLDTDVAGARAAGMTAVWLRPASADGAPDPDLAVAGWSELLEHVERALSPPVP